MVNQGLDLDPKKISPTDRREQFLTSSQRQHSLWRGIPKYRYLGFCFFPSGASAPALRELFSSGLKVAPQTIPASPAVRDVSKSQLEFSLTVDSRDVYAHCPVIFPRSTNLSAPPVYWTRARSWLSESIVSGGSTTCIVPEIPVRHSSQLQRPYRRGSPAAGR